jgi:nitrate/TMAO reductase-like tetraheme cytochrome c subunit
MAEHVWAEYKGNDSRACRYCHQFSKEVIAKQKEMVQPIHTMVMQGQGTCIDCHQGVAHTAPE